ncbi:hypothetical protein [Larkinella soli]|uniref:hypothetical protein n=1 Tax=Larkinella soli TaxID=1770527 RepID=UPI0013E3F4C1|nr:hypothetical protein [Larkinella soli]
MKNKYPEFVKLPSIPYFISLAEIRWIEAKGNYCCFHFEDGSQALSARTLRLWQH